MRAHLASTNINNGMTSYTISDWINYSRKNFNLFKWNNKVNYINNVTRTQLHGSRMRTIVKALKEMQLRNWINQWPTSCFFFIFMPWARTLLTEITCRPGNTCKKSKAYLCPLSNSPTNPLVHVILFSRWPTKTKFLFFNSKL